MLVLASSTVNALAPTNLAAAEALVARVYPGGAGKSSGGDEYGERLAIGRKAQLGDDLVYRPGLIGGGSVDTALTYGEYDLGFFATLVDRALDGGDGAGHSFVDVGSGCGRLVLAASELWPALARVSGVESVAELHALAAAASSAAPRAVDFYCADAHDALRADGPLSDASLVFAYTSTWPSFGDELTDFSVTCGTRLKSGTRVVTTDKRLSNDGPWEVRLLDALEGVNAETGGASVGFVQEVVRSTRG